MALFLTVSQKQSNIFGHSNHFWDTVVGPQPCIWVHFYK